MRFRFLYGTVFSVAIIIGLIINPAYSRAAPAAADFGERAAIYDAAISPNGKRVALIGNKGGQYYIRIHEIGATSQKPVIYFGERVKPAWIKWPNNTHVLVSVWQNELLRGTPITTGHLYSIDANKSKIRLLVKPDFYRQYNNHVVDFLEDDPNYILMSYSDTCNICSPGLFKVNVATGRDSRVKRGVRGVQKWYTDLEGIPRIGQGLKDQHKEEWVMRILPVGSDKWLTADSYPGLEADMEIVSFTKDPNEIVVRAYRGKNTKGLHIYSLSEKKFVRVLFQHDDYDASGVILNSEGTEIIGVTYTAEGLERVYLGTHNQARQYIQDKIPGYQIDIVDSTAQSKQLIFKASHPSDAGGIFLFNSETKKITQIGAMRPNLPAAEMGEVIAVRYTARDGGKIPAIITLPPTIHDTAQLKNLPFIILPHGGPYARDSKRFDYFAQFFATRGYGVLQMNFRGSTGYGKDFEEAGRENWQVMLNDIEDGVKWLLKKGYADPKRTCIAGWSYGGYAAMMGALKTPEHYVCAISMAGVTDLNDMVRDMRQYQFGKIIAQNFILKGFDGKSDRREASPVALASTLSIPLLLAHGTHDQRVHFDQYRRMKSALKTAEAPVTYVEFKGEDHFLSNAKNRKKFLQDVENFLVSVNGTSELMQQD